MKGTKLGKITVSGWSMCISCVATNWIVWFRICSSSLPELICSRFGSVDKWSAYFIIISDVPPSACYRGPEYSLLSVERTPIRKYSQKFWCFALLTEYCPGDHIEKNEMGGACTANGGEERRGVYRVLVEKPEGKRPLWRHRRKWEDNIRMDIQEWDEGHGLDWSGSGQGQVAGCCKRSNWPSGSVKYGECIDYMRTC